MDALMNSVPPNSSPRRTSHSRINLPISFVSGSFAGQTIRAELTELQKADLGRKYARVDRRPLDPPPVVLLKLFQVFNRGTEAQYEREIRDYSEVNTLGLLCNVDLFPVPAGAQEPTTSTHAQAQERRNQEHSPHAHAPRHHLPSPPAEPPHLPALLHVQSDYTLPPVRSPIPPMSPQARPAPTSHIITYFGGQPVTDDMNYTTALSGSTFIQLAMIEHHGRKALVFPFADLAVKNEGQFFLRYRCFDIFSRTAGDDDLPIQAECFGGPFKIYSTKEFPGLQPSTELTKQLARWGVRLNTRETERKRKRKDEDQPSNSAGRLSKSNRMSKESDSDDS